MTGIILDRALQALQASPFPRTPMPEEIALFVAGHGTPRNENSRSATQDQADLIRSQDRYAQVEAVFLEEEPRVSACCRLAQVRNVVVVPFFISDGLHVAEHIPVLLGEPEQRVRERLERGGPAWHNPTEKSGKLVWCARSVGTEPHLADVILERVREAAARASSS